MLKIVKAEDIFQHMFGHTYKSFAELPKKEKRKVLDRIEADGEEAFEKKVLAYIGNTIVIGDL